MAKRIKQARKSTSVTFEEVRQFVLSLPEVEEETSYGTPAFKVRGKLFARLHQGGDSIVVRIDEKERTMRMEADSAAYYITNHYVAYPLMLVRLSAVHRDDLLVLLEESWRRVAPKRLIANRDAEL